MNTKKKLFKNKVVYWLVIILNILLLVPCLLGFFDRIQDDNFENIKDTLTFLTICFGCLLMLITLELLILKNQISIIILSVVLAIITLIITIALFYSFFIVKDFGENTSDYFTVPLFYLIIIGFLYIMQKFKYFEDFTEMEIQEIGKENLNEF